MYYETAKQSMSKVKLNTKYKPFIITGIYFLVVPQLIPQPQFKRQIQFALFTLNCLYNDINFNGVLGGIIAIWTIVHYLWIGKQISQHLF